MPLEENFSFTALVEEGERLRLSVTPRSLLSTLKPCQASHGDDGRMDALCKEKLKKFKNRTVNRVVNCQEPLFRNPRVLENCAVTT